MEITRDRESGRRRPATGAYLANSVFRPRVRNCFRLIRLAKGEIEKHYLINFLPSYIGVCNIIDDSGHFANISP